VSPVECADRAAIAYVRVADALGEGSPEAVRAYRVFRYWEKAWLGEK
jgi:hypothetical protein